MATTIVRDSDIVELNGPPAFDYGDKVRSRRVIRNDGTFPGKDIGDILVTKGEEGYVVSIGTFLQQFYIYGVEFVVSGRRVGMKRRELDPVASVRGANTPGDTGGDTPGDTGGDTGGRGTSCQGGS